MPFRWHRDSLTWIALATMLFVLVRAATQSITIDEAMTYLMFTSRSPEFLWWPASNNHLLNSLLSYPFLQYFGPSELTVRAAAMIGAALYITAAHRLSALYSPISLRWTVQLCLTLNPMILDYLTAARGYGLATGFLLWAIVFIARPQPWTARRAVLFSLCLGLSVVSNFAFALINTFIFAAGLLAVRRTSPFSARTLAALAIPGLLSLSLAIPTLIRWPPGQLFFGAGSLPELFVTLLDGSLHNLPLAAGSPYIGLAIVALCGTFATIHTVFLWRTGAQQSTPLSLSRQLAATAVAALIGHWFLFRTLGILLPKERTALYLIPIATLILAGIASSPPRWTSAQRVLCLALAALAAHYALSLRWTYFHQWEWDADTRSLYQETVRLTATGCPRTVVSDWRFATCLEFYQKILATEPVFKIFSYESGASPVRDALFVLHPIHNRDIWQAANLQVLYRAPRSEAVIAAPANACLR
ncbi:MAG: hypothetical protein U0R19_26235 [Bryobacteraceae bacterium]